MNSLFSVLKATFINDWGLNAFSKSINNKKEKKKAMYSFMGMAIGAIAIGYMVTLYALLMADTLEQVGLLQLIVLMGILFSTVITFFSSLYKAQGSLFTSRDYDLLMSLPIKPSVIFASKMINLLLMNWLFTLFAVLPPTIIYFIRSENISLLYFVILMITIWFIPLIPVSISAFTAIIVSYFASKFKYKNLTTILGTIIVMVVIMGVSFKMQSILEYILANATSILDGINKVYPPIAYLLVALTEVNFIEAFKFIAISSITFILFILAFSKIFKLINSRLGESYKKANYKMTSLKTSSPLIALTNKEIKRYFSTPIYVLNTAVGMVMVAGGAIATLFIDGEVLAMYLEIPYVEKLFPLMILALIVFGIGLSTTTCSSISLEGKSLWIIKSLPISEKDIFIGKILLNLIITIPLTLVSNMFYFIGLKFSITYLIWNITISIVYCIFAAVLGLLINLYLPKLEWSTPTAVVKQSAAVLINMLVTFGIIGLSVGAFMLLDVTNINMFLFVILVMLVVILSGAWIVLCKQGVEKFREL